MKFSLLIILISFSIAAPSRAAVVKSPPNTTLYTYDLTPTQNYGLDTLAGKTKAWEECHIVAALQGLANRGYPRLYIYFNSDDPKIPGRLDIFWLRILRQPGGWLATKKLQPIDSFIELVTKFRPYYKGVVLYDLNVPATSHVASTVAGCDDLLPVPYDPTPGSVYDRLVVHGLKLPVKVRLLHADGTPMFTGAESGSAKCDAYLWAKRNYLDTGKCSSRLLGYYIDSTWIKDPENSVSWNELCSADYLIQHKAFFYDLSPWSDFAPNDDPHQPIGTDYKTLCAILRSAYNLTNGQHMISVAGFPPIGWKYTASHKDGTHGDVETEWHYASILSCFNAFLDSGDTPMANASVYCQYPLKTRYTQHKPTIADWKREGYVDASGKVAPHQYVTFYAGDYDCAAWLYQFMPKIWSDKNRGAVPVAWALNPNLAARFPVGMDWIRKTATPQDLFVCGDSAAGYLNPGYLDGDRPDSHLPSGVATWQHFCSYWYSKFDLSISGFVIDGFAHTMSDATAKAYASFSPDGVVDQSIPKQPAMLQGTNVPSLWMEWYTGAATDTTGNLNTAKGILGGDSGAGPHFHIWRTVLWTPTDHLNFKSAIEQAAPNAKVVDPYTLMGLEKLWLQQKGS